MPRAKVTHQWVDGAVTVCQVYVEPTFPDATDEARAQVMRMWRDTCTDVDPEPEYIQAPEEGGDL